MYENVKSIESGGFSSATLGFFKGVGIAALLTLLIFLISALLLSYTSLPESAIPYISFITQIIGALIAGLIPAKRARTRGMLTGSLSGFIYILIIWLIASLASDGFYVGKHILTMLLLSLIAGGIGGITGVNLKSTNNNKKR